MSPMLRLVDKDFLKKWTPEMAYVLGFFAADGYMWVSGRGAYFFGFQINDEELLIEIRKVLGSTHKIAKRIRRETGHADSFRLQIGSKEMFDDLLKLGMSPNKTHTLRLPNIPDKYIGDFVRGYFDGDGNVWIGEVHKNRKTKHQVIRSVFTSGSRLFLEDLKKRFATCGLGGGSIVTHKRGYNRLQYSIKDSIILSRLMYDKCDNKLFLQRKKCKFDEYIKQMRS